MAVAFSPGLDDEEEKKKAELSSQSGMLGGSGAQAVQAAPGSSSGRWTNMMSYVDANKNSTMGDTISGKIDTEKTTADTGVTEAGKGLTGYVEDKSLQKQANIPTDLMGDTSKVTAEGVSKVKSFQGQGFADGANPFLDASKAAAGNVQKVEDKSKNVGEASALQGFFGKDENGVQAQYSGGEKNLDSFILNSSTPGQLSSADKIREKFKGIGGAADTAYKGQVSNVDIAKNAGLATQQGLKDTTVKLKDWRTGVVTDAGKQAQSFNNNQAGERFDYGLNFMPGQKNAGAKIQKQTGMTPEEISSFMAGGGDLSKLLIQGDTAVDSDFIDDDSRARSEVLSGLGVLTPESFAQRRDLKGNSVDQSQIIQAQRGKAAAESAKIVQETSVPDEMLPMVKSGRRYIKDGDKMSDAQILKIMQASMEKESDASTPYSTRMDKTYV